MAQGFTRGVPIDTDPTMSLDSEIVVPSQSAVRDYVANNAVIPNAPISGATKTKITYDSKGLVTAGADIVAADISDSTDVGRDLVKLTNPSQISYLRINADNTVAALTLAQLKTDLGLSTTVLSSNAVNNDATGAFRDVTGLSFSVVNGGTYRFRFVIIYNVNNVTTGSRWSINGPTFTSLGYRVTYPSTAVTTVTNSNSNAYDTGTATTATPLLTGNISIIDGIIRPSADGTLIARSACEIVAGAIVTATIGSYVEFERLL